MKNVQIPSIQENNAELAKQNAREYAYELERLVSWLRGGLPTTTSETVWYTLGDHFSDNLVQDASQIYRDHGYFVRKLFEGHDIVLDFVLEKTVFEIRPLKPMEDKLHPYSYPGILLRIWCRLQMRFRLPRANRRYE